MKIIGLIGGISWISTVEYYKLINEGINQELGGLNFSNCIIYSFNYADIKRNNDKNDWESTLNMLSSAALHLQNSGADCILLCANTMHMIADALQERIDVPLIHIADETAKVIEQCGLKRVILLGTKFTMENSFFKDRLLQKGIEAIVPNDEDRAFIHYTIFEELGRGLQKEETKEKYLSVINEMIGKGAEGVILGCTEIPLLIKKEDVDVPVFDTTAIHADAAVRFSLGKG
ncbi:aspartate/glutamate racemase family protein [Danxiaibacter flavus]|uniref:Aspartate/glutamate racemase family protein n=1 Tax=Danxiaibacter flavus TaxID=3049108 RepID=A0ABV3Z8X7_9BACT|nr:aspartate/glutamate racemase family protein [Chitinophagaceae bacterium DXS]